MNLNILEDYKTYYIILINNFLTIFTNSIPYTKHIGVFLCKILELHIFLFFVQR